MMAMAVAPIARPMRARRRNAGRSSRIGEDGCSSAPPNAHAAIMKTPRPAASMRYSGQWRPIDSSMILRRPPSSLRPGIASRPAPRPRTMPETDNHQGYGAGRRPRSPRCAPTPRGTVAASWPRGAGHDSGAFESPVRCRTRSRPARRLPAIRQRPPLPPSGFASGKNRGHQILGHLFRNRRFGVAERGLRKLDRVLVGAEVRDAGAADPEVLFEQGFLGHWQLAFQVIHEKLDEILAGHVYSTDARCFSTVTDCITCST